MNIARTHQTFVNRYKQTEINHITKLVSTISHGVVVLSLRLYKTYQIADKKGFLHLFADAVCIQTKKECIDNNAQGNEEIHQGIKDYITSVVLDLLPVPIASSWTEKVGTATKATAFVGTAFHRALVLIGRSIGI